MSFKLTRSSSHFAQSPFTWAILEVEGTMSRGFVTGGDLAFPYTMIATRIGMETLLCLTWRMCLRHEPLPDFFACLRIPIMAAGLLSTLGDSAAKSLRCTSRHTCLLRHIGNVPAWHTPPVRSGPGTLAYSGDWADHTSPWTARLMTMT